MANSKNMELLFRDVFSRKHFFTFPHKVLIYLLIIFVLLCFPTNTLDCYCEGTNVQCNTSSFSYGNYGDPHLHVHTSCLYRQKTIIPFSSCRKALNEGTGNDMITLHLFLIILLIFKNIFTS